MQVAAIAPGLYRDVIAAPRDRRDLQDYFHNTHTSSSAAFDWQHIDRCTSTSAPCDGGIGSSCIPGPSPFAYMGSSFAKRLSVCQ